MSKIMKNMHVYEPAPKSHQRSANVDALHSLSRHQSSIQNGGPIRRSCVAVTVRTAHMLCI